MEQSKKIKAITLNKYDNDTPVLRLIHEDRESSQIKLIIPRWDNGIDLKDIGWNIKILNAEEFASRQIIEPVIENDFLSFVWTFSAIVASLPGNTKFKLEGIGGDGEIVWKSGYRIIEVGEDFEADVEYEPESVSDLQRAIEAASVKTREVIDELEDLKDQVFETEDSVVAAIDASKAATKDTVRIYNEVKRAYDDGELHGKDGLPGHDGISPTIVSVRENSLTKVIVTDATGEHIFFVMDGMQGDPGSDATVTAEAIYDALNYSPASEQAVDDMADDVEDLRQKIESIEMKMSSSLSLLASMEVEQPVSRIDMHIAPKAYKHLVVLVLNDSANITTSQNPYIIIADSNGNQSSYCFLAGSNHQSITHIYVNNYMMESHTYGTTDAYVASGVRTTVSADDADIEASTIQFFGNNGNFNTGDKIYLYSEE